MKLDGVTITYGNQTIIDDCHLEMNSGEIFVLMGPSGSGKSTLLKGIAGLLPLEKGTIVWKNGKGTTGLVFQEARLFPHMTVIENLAFGLRARGVRAKERNKIVREFLAILQLEELGNRYPHQLSGGQQQRVSLGRVLVLKPDVLLLDEPFSSLDTPLRNQLTEWLYKLQRQQSFSILWVTHYIDEAFSVADRVGVMMNGKILQTGKPLDFYQAPSSEKIATFFSLPNRLSLQLWKQVLKHNVETPQNHDMGWIPANALLLRKKKSGYATDTFIHDQSVVWLEGIVKRVKHEPKGYIVLVDVADTIFEVELSVWNSLPNELEQIEIGIPISRIISYPNRTING